MRADLFFDGRGRNFEIPEEAACSTCQGWGTKIITNQTARYREVKELQCSDCCGTGYVPIPMKEVRDADV